MSFRYTVEARKQTSETKAGGGAPEYGPWFPLAAFASEGHAKNFTGMLNIHKHGFQDFRIVEAPHEQPNP